MPLKNHENKNLIGKGNTAEVIPYEDGTICKLFFAGYPAQYAQIEHQNAVLMQNTGLPVPKVYRLIQKNGRIGIIYEYIKGIPLIHAFSNPKTGLDALEILVQLHKQILSCHAPKAILYQDFLLTGIKEKAIPALENQIRSLPTGNILCHGDFHPKNIMVTPEGKTVIIDFMNVCQGPREYDIARTFFLMEESSSMGQTYLNKMEIALEQIEPYLSVIRSCRKYGI